MVADNLPIVGRKQISLFLSNKEVNVTLSLQASRVKVLPDKNLSAKKHQTQSLSLVIAKKIRAVDNQRKDVFEESEASDTCLSFHKQEVCLSVFGLGQYHFLNIPSTD